MIKKCLGCGITLQDENPCDLGYTPLLSNNYCQRCFRLTNYQDLTNAYRKITSQSILDKLQNKKGIAYFFCDILNFNHEAFSYFRQIKMPKVFVVSKSDIIPKNIKYITITNFLKRYGKIEDEIIFLSTKNNYSVSSLQEKMQNSSVPVYTVGMTNAGKSSFLNTFLKDNKLTVSKLPNTTLDFIKLDITTSSIYDVAGFNYDFKIPENILKNITVSKEMKQIVMPLKENASLYIENIGRIVVLNKTSVSCFFSSNLKITKMYDNNSLYFDEECIEKKINSSTNLYIKGIGFCYFKESSNVKIYHLKEDQIDLMPSFIGGNFYE